MVRAWLLATVVACSGNTTTKARTSGDAAVAKPDAVASAVDAAAVAPSGSGTGDAQIRVEWKRVPAVMRASPGRTPCHTPRAPSVAPTTTWGIPDALVVVEGARTTPAEVRVVLADCALAPRLASGESLIVESAVERPTKVVLRKHGSVDKLDALAAGETKTIQLPFAGHAVAVALDAGGVYQLATDDKEPEAAWIVDAPAAVTDAAGVALVKELSVGAHAVTVWLPARGNQPAKLATGTVTVVANDVAELTVEFK